MANEKWSSTTVEAYLAKFQVEEMVQLAVNSAIESRAPDPVQHVADYLEARGQEMEALAVEQQGPAGQDEQVPTQ